MGKKNEPENWVPLVEFSVEKGISLSTLRRYIKADKIPWKLVSGRYLVKNDSSFIAPRNHDPKGHSHNEDQVKKLKAQLSEAQQEIAELKTLVALYEEKWSQQSKK